LLNKRPDAFKRLSQVLSFILLGESIYIIYTFFNGLTTIDLNTLILSLKGNTGNKNIMAASLVVKIPFCIYLINQSKLSGRIWNIVSLLMGVLAIFIINARSSYLGLIVLTAIYFAYCILLHKKEKNTSQTLYRVSYVLLPIIAAFILSQFILTTAQSFQDSKAGYGTVAERLGTLSLTNDASSYRFKLWEHAVDYIEKNPVFGCGWGNWKLASIPYEKEYINDLNVPAHAHNDFFETTTELGLPGGLLFLGLFILLLVYMIRVWKSSVSDELKFIAVIAFMALGGYVVDAFFNFPSERPVMQMMFALIAAIHISVYDTFVDTKEHKTSKLKPETATLIPLAFTLPATILLIALTYISFLTYQSLAGQRLVIPDLENEPMKQPLEKVRNLFPPIPNLSVSAQPLDAILGRYYYENKQYEKAIDLLNKGEKANPYVFYSDFLKADVYYSWEKLDSADKYAKKAFYNRPRAKTYYQTFIAVQSKRKDTMEIKKGFQTYIKYRNEPFAWNMYLLGMLNAKNAGNAALLAMADSALKKFPQETKDLELRRMEILNNMPTQGGNPVSAAAVNSNAVNQANQLFNEGILLFGKGQLLEAATRFTQASKLNPANYVYFESIGICYFNSKEFGRSIPYFNKAISVGENTGKPEYFKGVALINMGKKSEGCASLQMALAKKYPDAESTIKSNCN
ncbi:MAG: hypothetical protein RLZZ28_1360, partial [Bacteroidota bacterium]